MSSDDESMFPDDTTTETQSLVRAAFNGPPIIGIGGTTDQGLPVAQYHRIPWNPQITTDVTLNTVRRISEVGPLDEDMWDIGVRFPALTEGETATRGKKGKDKEPPAHQGHVYGTLTSKTCKQYADYNVESVFNLSRTADAIGVTDAKLISDIRKDLRTILAMLLTYNLYMGECSKEFKLVKSHKVVTKESEWSDVWSTDNINRALTFIAARVHTKYQTNHAMGGTVAQGSIASCIRAYYGVNITRSSPEEDRRKYELIYKSLYWALHPVNEPLILVQILAVHQFKKFPVHANGPAPALFELAEYMQLRSSVTAASTHHFAVGVACALRIRDFGLLAFLPNPSRLTTLAFGYRQAEFYAARCHPAARFWGLERVSLNQRAVADVVADLAYAIKQLFPADTLAASPICKDDSNVNVTWKTFIDGVKAKMDESVAEMVSAETMKQILPSLTAGSKEFAPNVIRELISKPLDEVISGGEWTAGAKLAIASFSG